MSYFPRTSAELNIGELRQPALMPDYDRIKAKIDRGINRQVEGRQEVAEGVREMIQTKAYLKKYKTIEAFAEHEYGKSPRWISHMLADFIPSGVINKPESEPPPIPPDRTTKKELDALKQVEQAREEPQKPQVKAEATEPKPQFHVEQFKPAPDMGRWATKVLAYIDDMPKSQIYGKLSRESIKVFQDGVESLRLLLAELLPQEPIKEPCKCGCGLSISVCEALFRVGVPSMGLTQGQAGMIMGRLKANDWRLPEALAFLKNEGELFVRRFKGKPAKK